jgi:hypothetical protein
LAQRGIINIPGVIVIDGKAEKYFNFTYPAK